MLSQLNIACGVVINRDGVGDNKVEEYCSDKSIPILLRIPLDIEIARLYSTGIILAEGIPQWQAKFSGLYNDTEGSSIYPTPVLGVVGIMEDTSKLVTPGFKEEGHPIILLGENKEELGASEYLKYIFNLAKGLPPQIDLHQEKRVQDACLEANSMGLLESAHDVSEGGLAISLAKKRTFSKRYG